ncbi:MAG: amidase, partial [Myxococcota bacterium]|nr:amidase [Myxococcota bacterium]
SLLSKGSFHGVPFILKDLKAALVGTPTSSGCRINKNFIPERNSIIVDRYEAAGVQIVGKSNSPEFGIMNTTEPELWGPCRNPWNTNLSPGGSSGGAAAAVAARIVPVAHAGDGGGSIRIPASCCGLFGLKPTRGRVSMAPHLGESWGGFVQEHVLTRSVRDSAAFLDLVDGFTPGEPYYAPPKERPWSEEVTRSPGKLRIAFTDRALFGNHNHPDCIEALSKTVELLRSLGHEVEEAVPNYPKMDLIQAYFITVACSIARMVEEASERANVKPKPRNFEATTWLLAQIGWCCSAPRLLKAQNDIHRAARNVATFFQSYDVFVTPTIAVPPVQIGELRPTAAEKLQLSLLRKANVSALLDKALETMGNRSLLKTPNTQLFNQTGQPAMSMPLHWNNDGMPIGVQFVGRFGREGTLFQLASQIEKEQPWAQRKPPLLQD